MPVTPVQSAKPRSQPTLLTVVLPVYNEIEVLRQTHDRLTQNALAAPPRPGA